MRSAGTSPLAGAGEACTVIPREASRPATSGVSEPVASTTTPVPVTASAWGRARQDEDQVGVVVGADEGQAVELQVGPVGGRQITCRVDGREQPHA